MALEIKMPILTILQSLSDIVNVCAQHLILRCVRFLEKTRYYTACFGHFGIRPIRPFFNSVFGRILSTLRSNTERLILKIKTRFKQIILYIIKENYVI